MFAREPYQPADAEHDLRALANVILVPHIGSNTVEANRRMALRALRNVRLAIDGDLAAMDLDQFSGDVVRFGSGTGFGSTVLGFVRFGAVQGWVRFRFMVQVRRRAGSRFGAHTASPEP